MNRSTTMLLPAVVLLVLIALVALTAGWQYGLVALLIGLVVVGGLGSGIIVAKAEDAPFAEDPGSSAGDTTQHSDVSSARS